MESFDYLELNNGGDRDEFMGENQGESQQGR